jgi:hypothetical protein
MWAYYLFEAHELASRRRREAELARLRAEATRTLAGDRPHLARRLGARAATSVSRLAAGLAHALDDRAIELPRRDAAS